MMERRTPHTESRRSGLTLAEVAISSFLVSVLMVAALRTVESSVRTWNASAETADGTALAKELLDEIMSHAYEEPVDTPIFGPESGEGGTSGVNRLTFDDIDDYHGWSQSPPVMPNGNPCMHHTGWSRSVTVERLAASNRAVLSSGATDEGLRRITVTATSPEGDVTTISAWRTSSGGMQQTLSVDQEVVTWVGCTLQAGASDPVIRAGTLISNHAEDN